MTCSGPGCTETAIMNCLTKEDWALVVNGGSFGERFVELFKLHEIPFLEIKHEHGRALTPEHLAPYEGKGYTTFLLQKYESSTGVHYDINLVGDFFILERPIVCFTYGYEEYKSTRGLNIDFRTEMPRGDKETETEVIDFILSMDYDAECEKKIKEKYTYMGGNATELCVKKCSM